MGWRATNTAIVNVVNELDPKLGSSVKNVSVKQENYAKQLIKLDDLATKQKNLPQAPKSDWELPDMQSGIEDLRKTEYGKYLRSISRDYS